MKLMTLPSHTVLPEEFPSGPAPDRADGRHKHALPMLCCDFPSLVAYSEHTIRHPITLVSSMKLSPVVMGQNIQHPYEKDGPDEYTSYHVCLQKLNISNTSIILRFCYWTLLAYYTGRILFVSPTCPRSEMCYSFWRGEVTWSLRVK